MRKFKLLIVFFVMVQLFSFKAVAFDIDLENAQVFGKSLGGEIDVYEKKLGIKPTRSGYGNMEIQCLNNRGFELVANKQDGLVNNCNVYFQKWNPAEPNKVPKEVKSPFNGSISYGLNSGSDLVEFVKILSAKFPSKMIVYSGNWCFHYSGGCNEPGTLVLLMLKDNLWSEIAFDEKDRALYLKISDWGGGYFQRINDGSIKRMDIVYHN